MLLGKPIGIVGVTFLLVKFGIAELPSKVTWRHIVGVGILGGIGFTMSILISGLAFPAEPSRCSLPSRHPRRIRERRGNRHDLHDGRLQKGEAPLTLPRAWRRA